MSLNLRDELIYAVISCFSDADGKSRITREKISQKTGIKKLDTITEHTNHLMEKGLIKKDYEFVEGKKYVIYTVIKKNHDYM